MLKGSLDGLPEEIKETIINTLEEAQFSETKKALNVSQIQSLYPKLLWVNP
jgi:hypothetical protein